MKWYRLIFAVVISLYGLVAAHAIVPPDYNCLSQCMTARSYCVSHCLTPEACQLCGENYSNCREDCGRFE
jgi:hypothetical protein